MTLQSASTPWVRTTASEVHSQQSLVRAARHDPRTELARFGHTHVTRAALRCPCVPGGLCSNDEPAAHLAAAQLRVERSLFPRLTRATAWRARLAGARIARARAVGRSASRPQQTVAAQRAARGLDPTAHRDRAELGLLRGAGEPLGWLCAEPESRGAGPTCRLEAIFRASIRSASVYDTAVGL